MPIKKLDMVYRGVMKNKCKDLEQHCYTVNPGINVQTEVTSSLADVWLLSLGHCFPKDQLLRALTRCFFQKDSVHLWQRKSTCVLNDITQSQRALWLLISLWISRSQLRAPARSPSASLWSRWRRWRTTLSSAETGYDLFTCFSDLFLRFSYRTTYLTWQWLTCSSQQKFQGCLE